LRRDLKAFAADRVSATVSKAFEGVAIRRQIVMIDGGIEDQVGAKSEKEHTYDLIYHVRGTLDACNVSTQPAEFLKGDGYPMLTNLQKGNAEKSVEVQFKLRDAPGKLVLRCEGDRAYEVFTGTCPDNPADKTMAFVMVRSSGKEAVWKNRIVVQP